MYNSKIFCAKCKALNENLTDRCINCGSLEKEMRLELEDTITLFEQTRIKSRGDKDKFTDQIHGYESSHAYGMIHKVRIIDKENDKYFEEIKDMDEVTIHRCEEKLSEHVGHGSAKRKKA